MKSFDTDLIGATIIGFSEQEPRGSEMLDCIILRLRSGKIAKIKTVAGRDNEWMEIVE